MIVLGLGSNIGDRVSYLRGAIEALRGFMTQLSCSPVYETAALLPEGAPAEWDVAFYNMAVSGETTLRPHALLAAVKEAERFLGREDRGVWGPREIDIDILAYHHEMLTDKDLTIPHAGLLLRSFALVPFSDVAPHWLFPVPGGAYGKTAEALAAPLRGAMQKKECRID